MAWLRTAIFNLVFWSGSVAIVLGAPLAALLGRRTLRRYVRMWVRFHAWAARAIVGIRVRVEGAIPPGQAFYAAKHQALFETLDLVRLLGEPVIVMKRELGEIPVWGWAARRYGMIAIDRAGAASAMRTMLRAAREAAADGRSVILFPEGTRVAPGDRPPLKPGLAGLYRALDLPVVPVALDSGRLWPRRGAKRAGVLTIRFGEPIPTGLPRDEIEARVHAGINALESAAPPQ